MLSEDGFVIDDGVVARLAPDRFHVTTTTGGAAARAAHMEDYLQTEWPDLQVWLTSITEQWAVIAVQGPRAREVLAPLVEGIDLSAQALPHMSRPRGARLRQSRAAVPCQLHGRARLRDQRAGGLCAACLGGGAGAARKPAVSAYGTEAMHVLRAEKGYIIVGQETDGTVIPNDLGLDWMLGRKAEDFVGQRSLARSDMQRTDRKQLVGLTVRNSETPLEEGAQVTSEAKPPLGTPALGHITSSYHSAALNRPIALALVQSGRNRLGQRLYVPMPSSPVAVEVVSPVFYDPKGERLNG